MNTKSGEKIGRSYKWVNTRKPHSKQVAAELGDYLKGVWVYWDPKFRASHFVRRDYLIDLKKWMKDHNVYEAVLGMDNLGEQCSPQYRKQLRKYYYCTTTTIQLLLYNYYYC